MSTQSELVLDRTRRLLTYLAAVSRELTAKPVRDVARHQDSRPLGPAAVPVHPRVHLGEPNRDRAGWLRVQKVPAPVAPVPPAELAERLDPDSLLGEAVPALRSVPEAEPEEESQRPVALLEEWLTSVWYPWLESSQTARQARRLYEALFTLELDADRLKASHELIWGHSLISWRVGAEEIRYPLLITNMVIRLDQADGSISVIPDGPPELQLTPLEGLSLPMIDDLAAVRERLRERHPDPWAAADLAAVHEQLIAPLGLDARIAADGQVPVPGPTPVITDSWVLALRPRPTRHDRFYRELAELLQDDSVLPQALAAVVSPDDDVRAALAELGQGNDETWRPVGERLLMPLAANAEQERIARQLARDRGVTVQGPPGTGKSHTIANLVSHLLAHGKRVLVTAQNEQALTVLRDKIPAELRDLSIAVLGSSSESMEQLRGSAQAVMDIASSVDLETESRVLTALAGELDELREHLRQSELAVLEALRTEDTEFTLPSGPTRAPDLARWLTEDESELDRIPDSLPVDAVIPLRPPELHELFELSAALNRSDAAALTQHRPHAGDLPTAGYLTDLVDRLDQLREDVGDLEARGLDVNAVDQIYQDQLDRVRSSATEYAQLLATLEEEDWLLRLRAGIQESPQTARLWIEKSEQLSAGIGAAMELHRTLLGHEITVPEGDYRAQQELLDELFERFSQGRGLPRIGAGDLRRLHSEITIDGLALRTPEEVRLVGVHLTLGVQTRFLQRLIGQLAEEVPLPIPPPGPGLLRELDVFARRLAAAVTWQTSTVVGMVPTLRRYVPGLSPDPTSAELSQVAELLSAASRRKQERALSAEYQALLEVLATGADTSAASGLWTKLRDSLESRDWPAWSWGLSEAARLSGLEGPSTRQQELAHRLAEVAPGWAGAIVRSCADPAIVGRPEDADQLWCWRRASTWLEGLLRQSDLKRLQSEVRRSQEEEQALVLQIARRGAAIGLKRNLKDINRRALSSWLNALGKLGKGTGKYSAHWQLEARNFLPAAMGAVPVWIMPVHRVIENFDPRVADLFDVVIVDESSQCDLLSVGVLALGAKAVVVGDDRQTSPAAVGVNRERILQLQQTYLSDIGESGLLTADESLYALSERIFPSTILLREHFRCVPEIIDFSNRYYNGEILPLREPSQAAIGAPLRLVRVPDGACTTSTSSADRINRAEAQALVDQVAACNGDPAYDGLTFGVVTLLGAAQGPVIEELLRDRLGVEDFQRRRLRVGNPAAFQGDERHIVFVSLVADDNRWAATKRADAQRVNVAASRAQDQLWVFHSVDPNTLHGDDERRALIEYVRDAGSSEPRPADLESRCESSFERDVLHELLHRGYELQAQHPVGRYRIDLVVIGEHGRLAIECDGDRFHGPEQWADDVRRQRQLERLGWTFWRIRASEFYRERPETLAALEKRLSELEIRPREQWLGEAGSFSAVPVAPVGSPAVHLAPANAPTTPPPDSAGNPATPSPDSAGNPATPRSAPAGNPVAPSVPVPAGYRAVGWIRPREAEAVRQAYAQQKDVVVLDEAGAKSGLAEFYRSDDPAAVKSGAQVALQRRRTSGSWTVGWIRDYEAEAILTAASRQEDFSFDDPDEQRSCLVQYYNATGPEAVAYQSSTRLCRRKPVDQIQAEISPGDHDQYLRFGASDSLTLRIKRAWVEASDTAPVIDWLNRFTRSPVEMLRGQEMLSLSFEGFGDVPDELPDLPAVRDYVSLLDREFPFWLFFLSKSTASLAWLLKCLLPRPADTEDFRAALTTGLDGRWFPAMEKMAADADFEPDEIDELRERAVKYFARW